MLVDGHGVAVSGDGRQEGEERELERDLEEHVWCEGSGLLCGARGVGGRLGRQGEEIWLHVLVNLALLILMANVVDFELSCLRLCGGVKLDNHSRYARLWVMDRPLEAQGSACSGRLTSSLHMASRPTRQVVTTLEGHHVN